MNLIREMWTYEDVCNFVKYLENFRQSDNDFRTKRIYNTNKDCFAIKIPSLRNFAKEIAKGDIISFLNDSCSNPIELNLIKGILICKINDTDLLKKYLFNYAKNSDSWVETDIIKIKVNDKNKEHILDIAKNFLNSEYTFVRRLGIILLFNFINDKYIDIVFEQIKSLYNEKEYYVNMAISWLLCECFIKQRELTIKFLENNILNDFVLKKFVSKCNDSYRVLK